MLCHVRYTRVILQKCNVERSLARWAKNDLESPESGRGGLQGGQVSDQCAFQGWRRFKGAKSHVKSSGGSVVSRKAQFVVSLVWQ